MTKQYDSQRAENDIKQCAKELARVLRKYGVDINVFGEGSINLESSDTTLWIMTHNINLDSRDITADMLEGAAK